MNSVYSLPSTVLRFLRRAARRLSVRVVLMGLLAIITLSLTQWLDRFIPREVLSPVTDNGVDRLLDIIANAMLAVTTFSLTVMVSVYRSSATQWTPRVHQLIMQDAVTQNTLAAFIGAYVFALVAIIMREVGLYDGQSAGVLFWVTVLVLAFVIWSIIRWTLHLQTLGSLIDTARQVEEMTRTQLRERLDSPCLGACPWDGTLPYGARAITARRSGYVQVVQTEALQETAHTQGVHLYLTVVPGSFVFQDSALAWVDGIPDDPQALEEAVGAQVVLGDVRSYDQDPRFGLLVMSEIGSKAMSPGVNDPGTAIDVLNRTARILSDYRNETGAHKAPRFDRLHVRPMDPADLVQDGFAAIARDGAAFVEVQERLQRALGALMRHSDSGLAHAARDLAADSRARAHEALSWPRDRARLDSKVAPDVPRE